MPDLTGLIPVLDTFLLLPPLQLATAIVLAGFALAAYAIHAAARGR